jgi:hypothetical protein
MMNRFKPKYEVFLAGALMLLSLLITAVVISHNYAGRLPAGEANSVYRSPMLRIRAVGKRIGSKFSAHVPLGDLDKLYQERIIEAIVAEDDIVEPEVLDGPEDIDRESEFRVTGIAWSSRRPLAFINGQGLVIGGVIGGWEVSDITESSVTLKAADGTLKTIGLYDQRRGEVKKDSNPPPQKAGQNAAF